MTFAGTVYNDLNGNGVLDPGDPGLQGWTVELLDSSGNIVATTTSAADGTYSFANLGAGRLHDRGDQPGRLVSRPSRSIRRAPTPSRRPAARTSPGSTSATSSS